MANFKCDICGGDIKMQANKTGVCQGCGMEYDIEAIRAMVGQQSAPAAPVQSAPAAPAAQSQDEIDRESLLVYLNDVRLLETMVKQSEKEFESFSGKIAKKSNSFIPQPPKKPAGLSEEPLLDDIHTIKNKSAENKKNSKKISLYSIFFIAIGIGLCFTGMAIAIVFAVLLFIIGGFMLFAGFMASATDNSQEQIEKKKEEYNKQKEKYEQRMTIYNGELQKYNDSLPEKKEMKKKFDAESNEIKEELRREKTDLKNTLAKAYSANIIPQQFRNIEGVYYLYDYLSTSNQSLSEALMQANLEAIKQKMDSMIKLQSAQIVQQAQTNAKLDNIQAQNERLAQLSEATMNNTAVAAKYAQIAAVNSELNAKLAAESLAYQKAAFWLK